MKNNNLLYIDILSVCDRLGIDLKQEGRRYVGFCPWHSEKRGSFMVYSDTNSFFCFSCQVGGNPLSLVSRLVDGVKSYTDLIKWFRQEVTPLRIPIRVSPPVSRIRKLFSSDIVVTLPDAPLSGDSFLASLGILYMGSGDYAGRHIIPVYLNNKLVAYEARDFSSKLVPKTLALPPDVPIHSYLWNLDNLTPGREVIIVEGIKGAIAVLKFGYLNVVSSFGARLTEDQVLLITTKQPSEVIIAYDGDTAGEEGSKEAIISILAWTKVSVVDLPQGTDPWDVTFDEWNRCLVGRRFISVGNKNSSIISTFREELLM